MNNRLPEQAITRLRLLAELDQTLARARTEAKALANDPNCTLEVGLLVSQLDKIAAEVEQIRLGRTGANSDGPGDEGKPQHWRKPPNERIAE